MKLLVGSEMIMRSKKCWKSTALGQWLTVLAVYIFLLCYNPSSVEGRTARSAQRDSDIQEDNCEELCLTPECIHIASELLYNMDPKVDPCENFHRYACGGFINRTILPDGQFGINNQQILTSAVLEQLKVKIRAKIEDDEPSHFKLVKTFYQICMKKNTTAASGLEFVRAQLDKLGGWPVLLGETWEKDKYNWTDAIRKFRNAGYFYAGLTRFHIDDSVKNSTRKYIQIYEPEFGINKTDISEGFNNSAVRDYQKEMVNIAVKLGADELQARKELNDSLAFEIKLANIRGGFYYSIYRDSDEMTLTEFSNKFPGMPWTEYIGVMLPSSVSMRNNEIIVDTGDQYYLPALEKLISETDKRDLANYLMWRVIRDILNNYEKVDGDGSGRGNTDPVSRSNECVRAVYDKFPLIAGAIFVKYYFSEEARKKAMEMVSDLKKQFQDIVRKADWVDEETRTIMLDKAAAMTSHVGYPDELFDGTLEKLYEKLNFSGDSYVESLAKVRKFEDDIIWSKLSKPVNRSDWMDARGSADVETYHYPTNNRMLIPAGMLQGPYFNVGRPNYINYGSIGFSIGHEITHGYDDAGKLFDRVGEWVDWGSKADKHWDSSMQCLIEQYGNYSIPELGMHLDSERTMNEDFSDNGGIKIAYLAYDSWAMRNGPEKMLPGLDLTRKQMFWLGLANAFCAKYEPEGLRSRIENHPHSPEEYQMVGSFSNMPEFAIDFNCPKDSRMNPPKRCSVW